jgi:hypothetical protein
MFHLAEAAPEVQTATIYQAVQALMKAEGLSEMDALKRVARERGIGKSEAYREFQREQAKCRKRRATGQIRRPHAPLRRARTGATAHLLLSMSVRGLVALSYPALSITRDSRHTLLDRANKKSRHWVG